MSVDVFVRAISTVGGLALLIAAVGLVLAPGAWRRFALDRFGWFGGISSSAQRWMLGLVGVIVAATGFVLMLQPRRAAAVVVVASFVLAALVRSRSARHRPAVHRLRVGHRVRRLRTLGARRRSLALTRRTVDTEVDESVQACADLAWWAARVTVGSVPTDAGRAATHTIAVPGRHGELTAVVPGSGALTLVLLTSTGPIDGVSVRVAI